MKRLFAPARTLAAALLVASASAYAAPDNLLPNGTFEKAAPQAVDWPDGWPRVNSGASWETEEGNRFLRLTSTEPGALVMLYHEVKIPEGVRALELTWKQRVSNLKKGKNSWFDARIMMEFADGERNNMSPKPPAANSGRNTNGWVERTTRFLVPEGAKMLKFMPALFRAESGTFDLDDLVLRETDPAPVIAEAKAKAEARQAKLAEKTAALQSRAAAQLESEGNLMSNGGFQQDSNGDNWPDHWSKLSSAEWGKEGDNRFLRITAPGPDQMTMLFRSVSIPAGTEALELSWRWRLTNLKPGKQGWFDARFMMDIKDAAGKKLKPQPKAPYRRSNTKEGWEQRSVKFLVPEGGVTLDFMPSLFKVKSGTLDLDDVVLKPTDAEELIAEIKRNKELAEKAKVPAEEEKRENWPAEIRAVGNRLQTADGKEVWLQGVNVPSLEWNPNGESVKRSVLVALDEWKANVIRLPVKEQYWFGSSAESYRKLVDEVVTLTANRGAYLVLDLHHYRAPREADLAFWTDAGTRYKNHPAVIFDLINEPHGISWEVWRDGGFVEEKKKAGDEDAFLTEEEKKRNKHGFMSPGMQAMVDNVRATGAKNLLVAGGLDYAYDLSGIVNGFGLQDPNGNGIMYASHIYPWKKGWQKKVLDIAALHPILVGEVGADANKMNFMPHDIQEDAETWVPDMLGLIQKYRLNWTGWAFHPKASPRMLMDWDYTPTPFWGEPAKAAMSGKQFDLKRLR